MTDTKHYFIEVKCDKCGTGNVVIPKAKKYDKKCLICGGKTEMLNISWNPNEKNPS